MPPPSTSPLLSSVIFSRMSCEKTAPVSLGPHQPDAIIASSPSPRESLTLSDLSGARGVPDSEPLTLPEVFDESAKDLFREEDIYSGNTIPSQLSSPSKLASSCSNRCSPETRLVPDRIHCVAPRVCKLQGRNSIQPSKRLSRSPSVPTRVSQRSRRSTRAKEFDKVTIFSDPSVESVASERPNSFQEQSHLRPGKFKSPKKGTPPGDVASLMSTRSSNCSRSTKSSSSTRSGGISGSSRLHHRVTHHHIRPHHQIVRSGSSKSGLHTGAKIPNLDVHEAIFSRIPALSPSSISFSECPVESLAQIEQPDGLSSLSSFLIKIHDSTAFASSGMLLSVSRLVRECDSLLRQMGITDSELLCAGVVFMVRRIAKVDASMLISDSSTYVCPRYFVRVVSSNGRRYIYDPDLLSFFTIARPSIDYQQALKEVPVPFVGVRSELLELVEQVTVVARSSFATADMPFPPWREPSILIGHYESVGSVDDLDSEHSSLTDRMLQKLEFALQRGPEYRHRVPSFFSSVKSDVYRQFISVLGRIFCDLFPLFQPYSGNTIESTTEAIDSAMNESISAVDSLGLHEKTFQYDEDSIFDADDVLHDDDLSRIYHRVGEVPSPARDDSTLARRLSVDVFDRDFNFLE